MGPEFGKLRVAIVDDHQTLVDLLAYALNAKDEFEFVGHAATVEAGLELMERCRPDVALIDLHLPDGDGMGLARRVRQLLPHTRVVILTAETDPSLIGRAADAGASAFVVKTGGLDGVLDALRTSRNGAMLVDAGLLSTLARPRTGSGGAAPTLTGREVELLQELAAGRDVSTAARRLGISPHTARGYVKSILTKLDCHSQLEAVVTAARLGLLRLDQAS